MTQPAQDRIRSDDGRWEWDGQAWRPATSHQEPQMFTAPLSHVSYVQPHARTALPTRGSGRATAALVLGIVALVAWLLPIVCIPFAVVGLVLGATGRAVRPRMATVGICLSGIGLVFAAVNSAVGMYLGATGQIFK